ncbi:MAG TPA: glycosyltransferase [Planctomycetota bacterium]|nr:glycosyltransferase [Planctomycetota bacterium]
MATPLELGAERESAPRGERRSPDDPAVRVLSVVTLTNLYPSASRPGHGRFVEERMTRYAARFGAALRVVAPVPWFPFRRGFGAWSAVARTPASETRAGVPIEHPRVAIVPKVGARLAPAAWVRACRPVLRRLQTERAIDVLDAHYLYPDGVAAVALARELQLPVVLSARGSDVNVLGALPSSRDAIVDASSRAGAVVAVSAALADRLASLGVPRGKISVVSNGVDLDRFSPSGEREPLGPGRVLLGVGRLVRGKGFHLAVESLARLARSHSDLALVLAGDGPERASLASLARARGVADRVRFLGEVDHARVPALLRSAHRFVLPSFHEGYPNVVVESIACGVPVVATAVGGVPELVDAEVGELASEAEAWAFTSALERSLARAYAADAFERRRARLRWDDLLDHLDSVFRRAIAAGPPH